MKINAVSEKVFNAKIKIIKGNIVWLGKRLNITNGRTYRLLRTIDFISKRLYKLEKMEDERKKNKKIT